MTATLTQATQLTPYTGPGEHKFVTLTRRPSNDPDRHPGRLESHLAVSSLLDFDAVGAAGQLFSESYTALARSTRDSELGQAASNLESRAIKASALLTAAESEKAAAVKKHFSALSGSTDEAIAEAREVLLAKSAECDVLRQESETLRKLYDDARSKFDVERSKFRHGMKGELITQFAQTQEAALAKLQLLIDTPEIRALLGEITVNAFAVVKALDAPHSYWSAR